MKLVNAKRKIAPLERPMDIFKGIFKIFENAGTIIIPPPTPVKPDIIPVNPPIKINLKGLTEEGCTSTPDLLENNIRSRERIKMIKNMIKKIFLEYVPDSEM